MWRKGFVMRFMLAMVSMILLSWPAAAAGDEVDIAIVVSLDRSESIDAEEAVAQITGLTHTLNHPRFLAAAQSGWHRRIALAVVTWSSFGRHDVILPWVRIAGADDAAMASAVLQQDLARQRIAMEGTQTDVAFGIETAMQQLEALPWPAQKRVINMVSDGMSNIGREAIVDRDAARGRGITINALVTAQGSAIRVLGDYFRRDVIVGPTAFVQITNGNRDFAVSMLRKMLLEITLLAAEAESERPVLSR